MREYAFTEFGYFTEGGLKKLKKLMDGMTYMNFDISWSSNAGNCTLIVKTDYFASDDSVTYEEEREEVKNLLVNAIIGGL